MPGCGGGGTVLVWALDEQGVSPRNNTRLPHKMGTPRRRMVNLLFGHETGPCMVDLTPAAFLDGAGLSKEQSGSFTANSAPPRNRFTAQVLPRHREKHSVLIRRDRRLSAVCPTARREQEPNRV